MSFEYSAFEVLTLPKSLMMAESENAASVKVRGDIQSTRFQLSLFPMFLQLPFLACEGGLQHHLDCRVEGISKEDADKGDQQEVVVPTSQEFSFNMPTVVTESWLYLMVNFSPQSSLGQNSALAVISHRDVITAHS